jgi:hypothetical protein
MCYVESENVLLYNVAVLQALELKEAQQQLQVMQQSAFAEVTAGQNPGQVLLVKLADKLADFLTERLLKLRNAVRISFASRLGLSPQPRPPFPPEMLSTFLSSAPEIAALFPQHSTYFAMGAMPPSVSLLAAPLAAGTAHWLRGGRAVVKTRHYVHSQCYAAIGLEGQQSAPQLRKADLRLCGVLVICLLDASGRVRHIGAVDVMPSRVFRRARELYWSGSSSASILAALVSPGHAVAQGWWTVREEPVAAAAAAQPNADHRSRSVCDEVPVAKHHKSRASAKDRGAGEGNTRSEWGPVDIGLERLQVACMLAWVRDRMLASHMRAELQGAKVLYEDQQMHQDPAEDRGGPGFGLRSVFLLRALPRRPPEEQLRIPEGFQPWPRVLLGHAEVAALDSDPPNAAVKSASITLTGPASWQLRVHGSALCAALRLSTQEGSNASVLSRWQWSVSTDEPDTIIREYSLHESGCRLQHCWRHVAEVLLTKELFVAFAILQPVQKPEAVCSDRIRFSYPGAAIDVTLLQLQQLQVRVCAAVNSAEHIGFAAEPGTVLLEAVIGHHLEHRIVDGQLQVFLSPVVSTCFSAPCLVFELALTKLIRSLDLQQFLDALAHTTVAHRVLAVPPDLSGLSNLSKVVVEGMMPPYRLLLVFETHAMALKGSRRFGCGLQLCAGGTATVHFGLRAQQVPRLVQEKLWPKASESQGNSGKLPSRILGYSELVRQLCGGQTPLARLPADPHAATFVEAEAGAVVVVQQGRLHYVVAAIAKHVDMSLPQAVGTSQLANAK